MDTAGTEMLGTLAGQVGLPPPSNSTDPDALAFYREAQREADEWDTHIKWVQAGCNWEGYSDARTGYDYRVSRMNDDPEVPWEAVIWENGDAGVLNDDPAHFECDFATADDAKAWCATI